MKTDDNYQKIVNSLKRRKKGATAADVCAATALPLAAVRDLLPKAADEYSAHLQVTQSGEILYNFPDGFTSRYRGFSAQIKKIARFGFIALKAALVFLFKVWIMLMLVGYFALFLAIALASVVLMVASQSKSSSSSRRSVNTGPNLFGLIWRIWFFNEITKPRYGHTPVTRNKPKSRPMHKAVFSFVFGDDDPDSDWTERESKTVITYIQANRGVISLAEYMAFTGESSIEAEKSILAFCAKYGGSPEVTEDGTIVYRFDELLLRADSKNFPQLLPPVKRLKTFSANPKSMNGWFIVINTINLIFGSYFLYHSVNTGLLVSEFQYQTTSYLYGFTHILLETITANPPAFIFMVLGLVPFVFSLFFWLIPAVRFFLQKKENEKIKSGNFKKIWFSKIWSSPVNVDMDSFTPPADECKPHSIAAAKDRVIKELGAVSSPDIETNEDGKIIYSFRELESEKRAIEKYRSGIDTERLQIGKIVYDSESN